MCNVNIKKWSASLQEEGGKTGGSDDAGRGGSHLRSLLFSKLANLFFSSQRHGNRILTAKPVLVEAPEPAEVEVAPLFPPLVRVALPPVLLVSEALPDSVALPVPGAELEPPVPEAEPEGLPDWPGVVIVVKVRTISDPSDVMVVTTTTPLPGPPVPVFESPPLPPLPPPIVVVATAEVTTDPSGPVMVVKMVETLA